MPHFVEHVVVRYLVVEVLPRVRVSFVELKPSRECSKLVFCFCKCFPFLLLYYIGEIKHFFKDNESGEEVEITGIKRIVCSIGR